MGGWEWPTTGVGVAYIREGVGWYMFRTDFCPKGLVCMETAQKSTDVLGWMFRVVMTAGVGSGGCHHTTVSLNEEGLFQKLS